MSELLKGVGADLGDLTSLRAKAEAILDASRSETKARLEVAALLAESANAALAAKGERRRFHRFAPPRWLDPNEPFWLLVTDAGAQGLVRAKLLRLPK
jgi:hypothetical protein